MGMNTKHQSERTEVIAIMKRLLRAVKDIENPYEHDYDNILMLAQHNAFYEGRSQVEDLIEEMLEELKGEE